MRTKELPQNSFEIPLRVRHTTKQIQTERAVFRKRVTREVRLREKTEAGDPAGAWKLMPLRLLDGSQSHLPDDAVKQFL